MKIVLLAASLFLSISVFANEGVSKNIDNFSTTEDCDSSAEKEYADMFAPMIPPCCKIESSRMCVIACSLASGTYLGCQNNRGYDRCACFLA